MDETTHRRNIHIANERRVELLPKQVHGTSVDLHHCRSLSKHGVSISSEQRRLSGDVETSTSWSIFLSSWPHIIKKDRAIIRRSPSIERYPIDPIHLPNRESKGRFRQHNVGLFGVSGLDERLLTRETGLIHLDPPRDNGGADIQQYHLELEEPKGKQCAPIDSSDWFRFSFILH